MLPLPTSPISLLDTQISHNKQVVILIPLMCVVFNVRTWGFHTVVCDGGGLSAWQGSCYNVTCHVVSHGPKMPSRLLMWCVVCDSACTCPVVVYQTPVLSRILRYTVATLHRDTNTLLHVTFTGTNHTACCKHDVMSFSGWLCLRIGNWMVPTYTLKQTMIFLTAHYTKMWISS